MSNGRTELCNQALMLLGEQTIQNILEDTPEAKACNVFYDDTLNHCLRDLKPSFAKQRATLTGVRSDPDWGFDHAYALPQDCLLVIALDHETLQDRQYRQWRVEGRSFLTDRTEPRVIYIKRDDATESLTDASFRKAMAAYLAYEMAYPLTNSNDKVAAMFELYNIRADDARATYGMESSTVKTINDQLTIVR